MQPLNKLFGLLVFSLMISSPLFGKSRAEGLYKLCAQCHGDSGEGMELVKAPAIAGLPSWYVMAQLKKFQGGARGGHPDDKIGMRMRPMARTLKTEKDMQLVSDYVGKMKPPKLEMTVTGKAFRGEKHYAVCSTCHGEDGMGKKEMNGPPLVYSNDWYTVRQLNNFKKGLRGWNADIDATGASMAGMAGLLDEQAMKDVALYIGTLRKD